MMEAAASPAEIFDALKDLQIFCNGELLVERKNVWQEACELLNKKIEKRKVRVERHNLYIFIQQNRHGVLHELMQHHGIDHPEEYLFFESDNSNKDEESPTDYGETSDVEFKVDNYKHEEDPNPHKLKPLNFSIFFDKLEWAKIKPTEVTYADKRRYLMINNETWTDMVVKKMWEEKRLTCCYAIKNKKFDVSTDYPFFTFFGYCSLSKTRFDGVCSREFSTDSESITVEIKTYETGNIDKLLADNCKIRKRKLKGYERREMQKKLKYVKGSCARLEEADDLLEYSEIEPAFLQTSIKLRKLRQEAIDRALNLFGPKDIFKSLVFLSSNSWPEIKDVNRFPLVIKYWLDEQLWKDLQTNIKWLSVSIDSSGSFTKQVTVDDDICGHLFLHVMVTNYENKIIPLWQMLSEKQDTNTIKLWLREAKSLGVPDPNEVRSDGSLALLNAVSLAYNNCSFKEYLNSCFRRVRRKSIKLPPCFVRMDRAHIMCSVSKWKCFTQNEVAKNLIERIIGLAINVKHDNMIAQIIFSTFLICNSPTLNPQSECCKRLKWLETEFESFNMENYLEEDLENSERTIGYEDEENKEERGELLSNNETAEFVMTKKNEAFDVAEKEKGNTPTGPANPYFCPEANDNLKYIFCTYLAWSAALVDLYGSPNDTASSACSETNFKDLKNNNWIKYPVSVNRFIPSHIILTRGRIKLSKSSLKINDEKRAIGRLSEREKYISELSKSSLKISDVKRGIDKIPERKKDVISERKVPLKSDLNATNKKDVMTIEEKISSNIKTDKSRPGKKEKLIFKQLRASSKSELKVTDKENVKVNGNQLLALTNKVSKEMEKSQTKGIKLIKNGLFLGAIKYGDKKRPVKFINTCAFDSTTEIFTATFHNVHIKSFVQKGKCQYLRKISEFNNNEFSLEKFYKDRAILLYPHSVPHQFSPDTRDCSCNVGDLLNDMLVGNGTDLLRFEKHCTNCGSRSDSKTFNTLFISHRYGRLIYDESNGGMNKLQTCLDNMGNTINDRKCIKCGLFSIKKTLFIPHHILIIEMEYMFTSNDITHNTKNDFPLILTVENEEYEIFGFIEIQRITDIQNHYVAYCYKNGTWEIRDSLCTSVSVIKTLPENLKISLLFYVKILACDT